MLLAELDDLPHREEVATVVQLIDQAELLFDLRGDCSGDRLAIALSSAGEGELAKPLRQRVSVGKRFGRIPVGDFVERERTTLRYLTAPLDQMRNISVEVSELLGALYIVLAVLMKQSAGFVEAYGVPNAGEDVLEPSAFFCVIEDLGRGHRWNPEVCRTLPYLSFDMDLALLPVPGDDCVQTVAEGISKEADRFG